MIRLPKVRDDEVDFSDEAEPLPSDLLGDAFKTQLLMGKLFYHGN
jgi:hypothetical protein